MSDIVEQMNRINNQVFQITARLRPANKFMNSVNCPKCGKRQLKITVEHRYAHISCMDCTWFEYYMRIVKRVE